MAKDQVEFDTLRLILADLLEEQGEEESACLCRLRWQIGGDGSLCEAHYLHCPDLPLRGMQHPDQEEVAPGLFLKGYSFVSMLHHNGELTLAVHRTSLLPGEDVTLLELYREGLQCQTS